MILAKAEAGIRFNEHMEGDGEVVFCHACKLGLEARERACDDFNKKWQPDKRLSARYALEEAARTFLERIMGVRTGSGLTS